MIRGTEKCLIIMIILIMAFTSIINPLEASDDVDVQSDDSDYQFNRFVNPNFVSNRGLRKRRKGSNQDNQKTSCDSGNFRSIFENRNGLLQEKPHRSEMPRN